MKKIKCLLFVLVISLVFIPGNILAKTKEEAEVELNKLAIENQDGSCTWDIKMMDPQVLIDNTCDYNLESIIKDNPWVSNLVKEEQEGVLKDFISGCRGSSIYSVVEVASRKAGNANWTVGVDLSDYQDATGMYNLDNIDLDNLTLVNYYDTISEYGNTSLERVERTCKVNVVETDNNLVKSANKILKKVDGSHAIYSLNSFNSVYHYGPIFQNNRIASDMILYKFPEFKNALMDNPEFEYEIAWEGGGGTPTETGCSGYVLAYKDGIPYGMKSVNFTIDNRLYVDEALEGTPLEKAEARLEEFFNNTVDVEFDTSVYEEDYEVDGNVGIFTNVNLGQYSSPIFIMEVDKKYLDKFEVKAHHKKYNVNVITNSYDVPLDATLEVEDVMNKVTLDNDEYKLLGAYDIDVVKTGTGSYVKTVENGIDVFIPVSDRKVGEKLQVIHVSEDLDEEFEGEVVDVDGVQYVKFRTNHFSTYAIAESSSIINPETSDTIVGAIILVLIGLLGILFVYKLRPRRS